MRGTPLITAFLAGETSPLTAGRVELEGYLQACDLLQNMLVRVHGPADKRPGTRFIAEAGDGDSLVRLIEFAYSAADNYILELGDYYMRFYTAGGVVISGADPYEIATPWAADDLQLLKFVQSADVMYFVHPDYPPQKLSRLGATNWTLDDVAFVWGPFLDQNTDEAVTVTPSAVTGTGITLTASSAIFNANHVGAYWKITGDQVLSGTMDALDETVSAGIVDAGENLICQLSGTWNGTVMLQRSFDDGTTWLDYVAYTVNTSFELTGLEDNTKYRWKMVVYTSGSCEGRFNRRNKSGYVEITGYTSGTSVTATVKKRLPSTDATWKWSEGAISAHQGYPAAIAMYEQRLILADTLLRPSTIWGSCVDDYENFKTGETDSDAWIYTLAGAKVNQIVWMSPLKVLSVGTIGDEWRFGMVDEPTTPSSVSAKKESEHGSSPIQPVIVEGAPVFVESGGRALRSVVYNLDEDIYRAPRISEHAEHLLRDGLLAVTFVQQPTPIIWAVRNDGLVISCTYSRSAKIAAFSRHDFGGVVESVASMRAADRDELWLLVKRYIDGAYVRYIERMEPGEWDDIEDAFYVDCGLSYQGAAAQTVAGLDHLEGETVNILADGAVHKPLVVSSGEITLDYAASTIHAGLPYTATLKTKQIDPKAASGSTQGKPKQLFKVYIRFDRTLNCLVGYEIDKWFPIVFRTTKTPAGDPPEPFTGDKEINMIDRGADVSRIVVSNSDPVPFTVLSISATMYASEL
jgi:hypothetical protein